MSTEINIPHFMQLQVSKLKVVTFIRANTRNHQEPLTTFFVVVHITAPMTHLALSFVSEYINKPEFPGENGICPASDCLNNYYGPN